MGLRTLRALHSKPLDILYHSDLEPEIGLRCKRPKRQSSSWHGQGHLPPEQVAKSPTQLALNISRDGTPTAPLLKITLNLKIFKKLVCVIIAFFVADNYYMTKKTVNVLLLIEGI